MPIVTPAENTGKRCTLNIRMDSDEKYKAESVFKELGITPSTAVRLFYQQVILHRGIPFSLESLTENPMKP